MTPTVCLTASTLGYPAGGGHRWAYLNWALGLRAAGCRVLWLEAIEPGARDEELAGAEAELRSELARRGLDGALALFDERSGELRADAPLDEIDVLLTLSYGAPAALLQLARRSAMIDIDPGLTQLWIREGDIEVPAHDMYFTIGEAARAGAGGSRGRLPDCGIEWRYTPPCVDLTAWPPAGAAPASGAYTTVSHWWPAPEEGWIELEEEWVENSKRAGFQRLLGLPALTGVRLELALGGLESEADAAQLRTLGWGVRDAWAVTASTDSYADYVRGSRGELSAVKPSYRRLAPGWISDRTLCYLASGRPAVVEYAGELERPEGERGLLQFRTAQEAADALAAVEADYSAHAAAARALAEARFDARAVAGALLEQVLA